MQSSRAYKFSASGIRQRRVYTILRPFAYSYPRRRRESIRAYYFRSKGNLPENRHLPVMEVTNGSNRATSNVGVLLRKLTTRKNN